jgi:hypothetical protein
VRGFCSGFFRAQAYVPLNIQSFTGLGRLRALQGLEKTLKITTLTPNIKTIENNTRFF